MLAASSKIRVVHVVPQLEMGGLEKLMIEFAKHVDRERFVIHFISLGNRGLPAAAIESLGWPLEVYSRPFGLKLDIFLKLVKDLKRLRPDVVHSHNNRPMVYASWAAWMTGVPVSVCTRHGRGIAESGPQHFLHKISAHRLDRLICVSEDSRELAEGSLSMQGKTCSIWNGLDLSRFHFSGPALSGPVLAVGRLSKEKGADVLLRAADLLRKRRPDFRLELAGDGPARNELEALSRELRLGDHVKFLGEVSNVEDLLHRARLYVLPSLTEGISVGLLEAMACGLPVVATAVGGTPEVVEEGSTGYLVPVSDPFSLANAIERALADDLNGKKMGQMGRERVMTFFDVRTMLSKYESLYLELLNSKK